MENYLVSCILTTYNRCDLLKRSLDSILNQTYRNLEILIIDDCSSDNTEKFDLDAGEKAKEIQFQMEQLLTNNNI